MLFIKIVKVLRLRFMFRAALENGLVSRLRRDITLRRYSSKEKQEKKHFRTTPNKQIRRKHFVRSKENWPSAIVSSLKETFKKHLYPVTGKFITGSSKIVISVPTASVHLT